MKEWVRTVGFSRQECLGLSQGLGVPEIFAKMLLRRGVTDIDSANSFLRPAWKDLHDPFLMRDMHTAVDTLFEVIEGGEKILVYGDYDVDGTSAVALVVSYLREIGVECDYYIPDRYKEGYGFSETGVQFAIEQGHKLIITLDCGIKDAERIARAKAHGIRVIVCDHHTPGELLPDADAVLNPKRRDCDYPFKELCGCAVGFKLMTALNIKLERDIHEMVKYLDLVALATGADIVEMTGENRVLASLGMEVLNRQRRAGISALLEQARFKGETMDITNVVFIIAPRINAAGRIFSGRESVNLLLEPDVEKAATIAGEIEKFNRERKEIEAAITAAAMAQHIASTNNTSDAIVVHGSDWHKGVIGIVASKMVESFGKPAIVLTTHNGELHGSGRSTTDMDLYAVLEKCKEHLTQFGGHTMAAGLSLPITELNDFTRIFNSEVKKMRGMAPPLPKVFFEEELTATDITRELYELIKKLEPFGPGNDKPYFLMRGVTDSGESRVVGGDGKHLRVSLSALQGNLVGIGFGMAEKLPLLKSPEGADILVSLELNTWMNKSKVELNIREMRKSQSN